MTTLPRARRVFFVAVIGTVGARCRWDRTPCTHIFFLLSFYDVRGGWRGFWRGLYVYHNASGADEKRTHRLLSMFFFVSFLSLLGAALFYLRSTDLTVVAAGTLTTWEIQEDARSLQRTGTWSRTWFSSRDLTVWRHGRKRGEAWGEGKRNIQWQRQQVDARGPSTHRWSFIVQHGQFLFEVMGISFFNKKKKDATIDIRQVRP